MLALAAIAATMPMVRKEAIPASALWLPLAAEGVPSIWAPASAGARAEGANLPEYLATIPLAAAALLARAIMAELTGQAPEAAAREGWAVLMVTVQAVMA